MDNILYAYWTRQCAQFGKVVYTEKDKNNNTLYFIHWDDEELARNVPYSEEDIKSGDLIIGKNIKLLYGKNN